MLTDDALLKVTVCTTADPSVLLLLLTLLTVGAASSSVIVPVPVVPPTVSSTVSFGSSTVSLVVGTVTVKLVTPAGTVKLPPLNVTPLLNVALANAVKSPALAVLAPPPSVAANVVALALALLKLTVYTRSVPSVTVGLVTLLIVGAASLSVIVPVALFAPPMVMALPLLVPPVSVTIRVSLPSNKVSLLGSTTIVPVVLPAAIVMDFVTIVG